MARGEPDEPGANLMTRDEPDEPDDPELQTQCLLQETMGYMVVGWNSKSGQ